MRRRNLYIAGMILLAFVFLTLLIGLAGCAGPYPERDSSTYMEQKWIIGNDGQKHYVTVRRDW